MGKGNPYRFYNYPLVPNVTPLSSTLVFQIIEVWDSPYGTMVNFKFSKNKVKNRKLKISKHPIVRGIAF